MARAKKDVADVVSKLLDLAEKVQLPGEAFECEIQDECESEARKKAERLNNGLLIDKLEFLLECGYGVKRLEELIREAAKES